MYLSLLAAPYMSAANIYKWTDKDGSIHFSDKPHKGARTVRLKPVQTYNPKKVANLSDVTDLIYGQKPKAGKGKEAKGYSNVEITQPKNDAPIRSNNGNVTFVVALEPGLEDGHQVAIYVDGALAKKSASTAVTVQNIDRGTHKAIAVVMDSNDVELKSSGEVTFHLLRHHANAKDSQSKYKIKAYIKNAA